MAQTNVNECLRDVSNSGALDAANNLFSYVFVCLTGGFSAGGTRHGSDGILLALSIDQPSGGYRRCLDWGALSMA